MLRKWRFFESNDLENQKKKKMKKRVSVLFICIIYLFVSIKQCDLQVKCQNAIFAFHSVCVSYCTARRKHVLFFTAMENLPKIQLSAIFRFFCCNFSPLSTRSNRWSQTSETTKSLSLKCYFNFCFRDCYSISLSIILGELNRKTIYHHHHYAEALDVWIHTAWEVSKNGSLSGPYLDTFHVVIIFIIFYWIDTYWYKLTLTIINVK